MRNILIILQLVASIGQILTGIGLVLMAFYNKELEINPYYQNIHFANQKSGRFELSMASFSKYELFMYSTPTDRFKNPP